MNGLIYKKSPNFPWCEFFALLSSPKVGSVPGHVETSAGVRPQQCSDRQLVYQIMGETDSYFSHHLASAPITFKEVAKNGDFNTEQFISVPTSIFGAGWFIMSS